MRAAAVLMDILKAAGVRHLFGNPGTTELAFLDALPDSGIEYVLALQESTATAAADGYAQASGGLGVVNLHVGPGLANGLAVLHNAARARSPLVVTAGQQDSRLLMHAPILAADLVQMTTQFTKWSYEIRRAAEAPAALRRALQLAQAPPTGPVFLSLPMDLMTEAVEDTGRGPSPLAGTPLPDPAAIARAAETLAAARAPLVIAGDGIARAEAVAELVAVAERLGARVHGEPLYRRASFPGDHPLWRGALFPTSGGVAKAVSASDGVLIVGADVFTWFLHTPDDALPRRVAVVQMDDDPGAIGRSHPVTLGILAGLRAGLRALGEALAERMSEADRAAAAARLVDLHRARAEGDARVRAAAAAEADRTPISPAFLMHTLASLVPENVIVVDESASALPHVLRAFPFKQPGSFFGSKTGMLGWGMGAAVGVQLAAPARKVVATVGDGSLMYAPQALWTAAHRRLPITYIVPNNASYAILKAGMLGFGLDSAKRGIFPGMDLVGPEIDYLALGRALGVRAERVDKPADLRDVLAACLAHDGPTLVDVPVDRAVKAML